MVIGEVNSRKEGLNGVMGEVVYIFYFFLIVRRHDQKQLLLM